MINIHICINFLTYPLQAIGVVVANDGVIKVTEAIQFYG